MLDGVGSVCGDFGPQTTDLGARDLACQRRAMPMAGCLDGRERSRDFLFGDEHANPSAERSQASMPATIPARSPYQGGSPR